MPDDTPHLPPVEVANLWAPDPTEIRLPDAFHLAHSHPDFRELASRLPFPLALATRSAANDDEPEVDLDWVPDLGLRGAMETSLAAGIELSEARDEAEFEVEDLIDLAEIRAWPSPKLLFARSEAWLAEARTERREDPERCLFAAVLAVSFAASLKAQEHPEGEVAKLTAAAWTELANARRLTGDFESAEAALHRAVGTVQDLQTAQEMGEVVAFLLVGGRRFDEAEEILLDLQSACARLGDRHSAGCICLRRGLAAMYRQDDRLALEHFLTCLRLLDLRRDPALTLAAFHNTIACTTRLGHFETARAWLVRCAPLYEESGDRTDLIRRRWAEAQIEAGLGNLARADAFLLGVREDFENLDLPYEAAIVTLDLCEVWIRRGKFREVARGVDEALSTFQALKIGREALAGLLLLQEAARAEGATVAMVQAAGAALRAEGR